MKAAARGSARANRLHHKHTNATKTACLAEGRQGRTAARRCGPAQRKEMVTALRAAMTEAPERSPSPSRVDLRDEGSPTANGLFTNTNPECRRVVPTAEQMEGKTTTVKVVYVVLEAQYQASLSEAVEKLNNRDAVTSGGVGVEIVGYLLEELRDAKNYEEFKKDVETANVFIGSLIFIEELADKVIDAVQPQRAVSYTHLTLPTIA